jgi:glycerol-3-phosphate acyltransferase PlsY
MTARTLVGFAALILGAVAIAALGAFLGHSFPVRAGLAVATLASFPLIERILP